MTDLFFLRHGQAGDRETWQGPDEERPLTDEGRAEIEAVATFLAHRALRLDAVVSSPLVRARQTAEIVAVRLAMTLDIDDLLAPGLDVKRLWRLVRLHPGARRILLVGHEPDFSATIQEVIGGGTVTMKKGGLARVRLADQGTPRGSLLWLAPPGLLLPSAE